MAPIRLFLRNIAWTIVTPLFRLSRYIANVHGYWRLDRLGYLDFLEERAKHALPPEGGDLWFLYLLVRSRKPRLIIEFGSGCSTVIFARALYDNSMEEVGIRGRIISLDAEAEWAKTTKASIPENLAEFCDIRHVPAVQEDRGDDIGFCYADLPDGIPDFLYVDGPSLLPERKICFDAFHMQDRFQPGFIMVVDGRHDTVRFLRENLIGEYKIERNLCLHNTVFEMKPLIKK